jgi:hypothetical protein
MTKLKPAQALALAATLTFLPVTLCAQQPDANASQASTAVMNQAAPAGQQPGQQEAGHMVPASVMLLQNIDARKMQPGDDFKAKLSGKVHLTNGTELPSGTIFEGTLANDDMNMQGNSKLVLRFTKANLKDGTTIPIKATIVAVYTPQNEIGYSDSYNSDFRGRVPNSWNDGTLAVDQIGVASGVDLHSKVSSQNSGVLVTATKDDVKLAVGTDFSLAVAAGQGSPQTSSLAVAAGAPAGQ